MRLVVQVDSTLIAIESFYVSLLNNTVFACCAQRIALASHHEIPMRHYRRQRAMENRQSFQAIKEQRRPFAEPQTVMANDKPMTNAGRPLATKQVREPVDIFAEIEPDDAHDTKKIPPGIRSCKDEMLRRSHRSIS
jgi:hypothetical protein